MNNEFMYELPMGTRESSFFVEVDGALSKFTVIFQHLDTLSLYQAIVADWDCCDCDCVHTGFTSDKGDRHIDVSIPKAKIKVHIEVRETSYIVIVSELE